MSYYSNKNDNNGSLYGLILCVIILTLMPIFPNSCSASEWNNGVCPDCEVRYELSGASRGLKYYSCPQCGNEVKKY
jgi:hypothetical protein